MNHTVGIVLAVYGGLVLAMYHLELLLQTNRSAIPTAFHLLLLCFGVAILFK